MRIHWERAVIAGCAYELIALTTGRVPTLSAVCRQHRTAEAALITALLIDFHLIAREASHPAER